MPAPRRYHDSCEVRWPSPTREVYEEGHAVFDVHAAKGFLASNRVPVEYVPVSELSRWTQATASGRRNPDAARLEASRIARADPAVPLILARTPRRVYLIDGHHRLERGRQLGYTEFPVVVLRDPAIVRSLMRGSTKRLPFWWHWRGPVEPRDERPAPGSGTGNARTRRPPTPRSEGP